MSPEPSQPDSDPLQEWDRLARTLSVSDLMRELGMRDILPFRAKRSFGDALYNHCDATAAEVLPATCAILHVAFETRSVPLFNALFSAFSENELSVFNLDVPDNLAKIVSGLLAVLRTDRGPAAGAFTAALLPPILKSTVLPPLRTLAVRRRVEAEICEILSFQLESGPDPRALFRVLVDNVAQVGRDGSDFLRRALLACFERMDPKPASLVELVPAEAEQRRLFIFFSLDRDREDMPLGHGLPPELLSGLGSAFKSEHLETVLFKNVNVNGFERLLRLGVPPPTGLLDTVCNRWRVDTALVGDDTIEPHELLPPSMSLDQFRARAINALVDAGATLSEPKELENADDINIGEGSDVREAYCLLLANLRAGCRILSKPKRLSELCESILYPLDYIRIPNEEDRARIELESHYIVWLLIYLHEERDGFFNYFLDSEHALDYIATFYFGQFGTAARRRSKYQLLRRLADKNQFRALLLNTKPWESPFLLDEERTLIKEHHAAEVGRIMLYLYGPVEERNAILTALLLRQPSDRTTFADLPRDMQQIIFEELDLTGSDLQFLRRRTNFWREIEYDYDRATGPDAVDSDAYSGASDSEDSSESDY